MSTLDRLRKETEVLKEKKNRKIFVSLGTVELHKVRPYDVLARA
jgi:hypothetical protein